MAAEELLAAIVESSSDAILAKTLDGEITTWNLGAELMYGYAADEIIGRNVSTLIPPEQANELSPLLARIRNGERVEHFETHRLRKDGTVLDVSITVSPVRDHHGAVVGASTVARDVTERNRAESDRRSLENRLHQAERLESLGQLAGGIAHDFNNLLTVIMNYAAFVADETEDLPEVRADVEHIVVSAERAARLTKQLLTFSRRETVQLETLDLNSIVEEINNLLSRTIGAHIELDCQLAEDLPAIRADRGQVDQVLLNLAVNARDAMTEGGVLTIETSLTELDDGYAAAHPGVSSGHYVELTVSDTGTGMTGEVTSHIFEPFFTTKPLGQGTGLGLSTVYGILTETGGAVRVYSEVGIGTTFRLYFPISDKPASPVRLTHTDFLPRGSGETILIVEDEPALLEMTSRILRQHGYVALEAGTYEEALSLASSRELDLLLTDSVMPYMSGYSLAERVGTLKPGVAVLFMSGYSRGVLGPRRILDEGTAFLQKPFSHRVLLERVRAVLHP
jgi:PAS domain S-box-containing protein